MRALLLLGIVGSLILAGCLAAEQAPDVGDEAASGPGNGSADRNVSELFSFTGKLTGLPVGPTEEVFNVTVPESATEVKANLSWGNPLADLALILVGPDGKEAGRGFAETTTNRAVSTIDPPTPGEWQIRVVANRAYEEAFRLAVEVGRVAPGFQVIQKTYNVEANSFAEVNLIMEANATFNYTWKTQGGETVYFNIHSHQDGKTVRHEEGESADGEGTFVAPTRQVYSLLWRNPGVATIPLETTIAGEFRVHSLNHH
ncbi:MAG TPA: hypothetical protein VNZ52_07640 [Candidatus Thermoplasmatota archaeon]|nr:hypothetical protein [Candidatus Thermoplasmatota archaeon]